MVITTATRLWQDLMEEIGYGRMTINAYDTAWIARLGDVDEELAGQALERLRSLQLADGSWGAPAPWSAHDRLICTLGAVNALLEIGAPTDQARIDQGLQALPALLHAYADEPEMRTVGFEVLLPSLLHEAATLGAKLNMSTTGELRISDHLQKKMDMVIGKRINKMMPHVFSAEFAGHRYEHLLDINGLTDGRGAVGSSPAATAYYLSRIHPEDAQALRYLRNVVDHNDGGAPNVAPFDTFEVGWVLWNLHLTGQQHPSQVNGHLDFLERYWHPETGIGFSSCFASRDGDDTGMIHAVLKKFNRPQDIQAVLYYEEDTHYRCFLYEVDPSVSAHVHILGALRQSGFERHHPKVTKAISFLASLRQPDGYWVDKWHASPFYATGHAIIVAVDYVNELITPAVEWMLAQQRPDGSWGRWQGTAEETAYALQALILWRRNGGSVPNQVLRQGFTWLQEHQADVAQPLWIGKCLYAPIYVNQSTVLSALSLYEQGQ